MVHRRAFSFTDDSASIPLKVASKEEFFGKPWNLPSSYSQLASSAHQKLCSFDIRVRKAPWPIIATGLSESRAWAEHLSDSISTSLRALFHSELVYINGLLIRFVGALPTLSKDVP